MSVWTSSTVSAAINADRDRRASLRAHRLPNIFTLKRRVATAVRRQSALWLSVAKERGEGERGRLARAPLEERERADEIWPAPPRGDICKLHGGLRLLVSFNVLSEKI